MNAGDESCGATVKDHSAVSVVSRGCVVRPTEVLDIEARKRAI